MTKYKLEVEFNVDEEDFRGRRKYYLFDAYSLRDMVADKLEELDERIGWTIVSSKEVHELLNRRGETIVVETLLND